MNVSHLRNVTLTLTLTSKKIDLNIDELSQGV